MEAERYHATGECVAVRNGITSVWNPRGRARARARAWAIPAVTGTYLSSSRLSYQLSSELNEGVQDWAATDRPTVHIDQSPVTRRVGLIFIRTADTSQGAPLDGTDETTCTQGMEMEMKNTAERGKRPRPRKESD